MPYITTYSQDGVLISQSEIDISVKEYQKHKIKEIAQQCSFSINICGLDSITQQNAALGIYEPERCEAIKNYIAACRNEYLRCKALILAATSNDEADAVQFQPPSVPENL